MRGIYFLCVLCTLGASTIAGSPPSFCKCTCFTNSTIIPLSSHSTSDKPESKHDPRTPASTCTLCNRAFCLAQRLPICKEAGEKDILTTCFQRDSTKDQIVVLTFIAGTLGLLGWAAIQKILDKRKGLDAGIGDAQQGYAPVGAR
ncbi:hypothetical protein DSL72_000809 [Monilinia vaccinii-corymbosi]|uniref:Uncharacterized protein n=1 Tax=Monilinia vaccinii-corymbosi TaxID=61207 RepID=A0A8A3P6I1_9HELO|nr:hypothetical protein DSL72_000809 [Monilinia vaccinii-corymbosi]